MFHPIRVVQCELVEFEVLWLLGPTQHAILSRAFLSVGDLISSIADLHHAPRKDCINHAYWVNRLRQIVFTFRLLKPFYCLWCFSRPTRCKVCFVDTK